MNRIQVPASSELQSYLESLRRRLRQPHEHLRDLFEAGIPICIARAPGRLDVMGGIGDYSGSLGLELPIREAAFAVVQLSPEPGAIVVSFNEGSPDAARRVVVNASQWTNLLQSDYREARDALRSAPDAAWAAYALGPVLVLCREKLQAFNCGVRILIDSRVPEGKGVSSSAALEVATMQAAASQAGLELPGEEIARLCQMAENLVVGAPCGIMDQMTSAVGRESHLLALRCQPAVVEGHLPIPSELAFWGIDSGIRHAVTGSDYSSVRIGAFMGYRIIAEVAGLCATSQKDSPGHVDIKDDSWNSYLANLSSAEFNTRFADAVPLEMSGREFLDRYGGITDRVTRVDPARTYAVRGPTLHPIEENERVERFRGLLQGNINDRSLAEMGALMYAAHESYSACGLGSEGTDLLVKLVRESGENEFLHGAKITGGGSGGTVAVLGRADAGPAVETLARQYTAVTGRAAYLFRGSSAGASATGVLQFKLDGK
jgi:galactokinase